MGVVDVVCITLAARLRINYSAKMPPTMTLAAKTCGIQAQNLVRNKCYDLCHSIHVSQGNIIQHMSSHFESLGVGYLKHDAFKPQRFPRSRVKSLIRNPQRE